MLSSPEQLVPIAMIVVLCSFSLSIPTLPSAGPFLPHRASLHSLCKAKRYAFPLLHPPLPLCKQHLCNTQIHNFCFPVKLSAFFSCKPLRIRWGFSVFGLQIRLLWTEYFTCVGYVKSTWDQNLFSFLKHAPGLTVHDSSVHIISKVNIFFWSFIKIWLDLLHLKVFHIMDVKQVANAFRVELNGYSNMFCKYTPVALSSAQGVCVDGLFQCKRFGYLCFSLN